LSAIVSQKQRATFEKAAKNRWRRRNGGYGFFVSMSHL
jgi:hypothetical protein